MTGQSALFDNLQRYARKLGGAATIERTTEGQSCRFGATHGFAMNNKPPRGVIAGNITSSEFSN